MSIPFSVTELVEDPDEQQRRANMVYGSGLEPMPELAPAVRSTVEVNRQATERLTQPQSVPGWNPSEASAAAQEDPFGDQPTRHAAFTRWQQLSPEWRQQVFDRAIDEAMTREGITDPGERERWKYAVAKGDDQTPGENPWLNPYAQAYDLEDRPGLGVNPRLAGTPQGDATASSARGYFQFLHRGSVDAPSTWDLVRLPSKDGEDDLGEDGIFDPVANARGYIRAVNRSSNYQDPLDPWREKQRVQTWSPFLPMPPTYSKR